MYLDCAVFENYRNIVHFPFSFDPGINILYGKNAQGKTNVIEGIYSEKGRIILRSALPMSMR